MDSDRFGISLLGNAGDYVAFDFRFCGRELMKFVPAKWSVREQDITWAMQEFNITREEVGRQVTIMRDHEFKRSYTDWNRVFRNWMRKAEEINTLHRDRRYSTPPEPTAEEREQDKVKAWAELNRLKAMKGG